MKKSADDCGCCIANNGEPKVTAGQQGPQCGRKARSKKEKKKLKSAKTNLDQ